MVTSCWGDPVGQTGWHVKVAKKVGRVDETGSFIFFCHPKSSSFTSSESNWTIVKKYPFYLFPVVWNGSTQILLSVLESGWIRSLHLCFPINLNWGIVKQDLPLSRWKKNIWGVVMVMGQPGILWWFVFLGDDLVGPSPRFKVSKTVFFFSCFVFFLKAEIGTSHADSDTDTFASLRFWRKGNHVAKCLCWWSVKHPTQISVIFFYFTWRARGPGSFTIRIYIYIYWVVPLPSNSGKRMFIRLDLGMGIPY